MVEESPVHERIEAFLKNWPGKRQSVCDCFRIFCQELASMAGVSLSFTARPGVSYSLRANHRGSSGREFFAIVDVIDDEPENRWLSVCFYQDMITDPEELGECIPGGLAGGDGYCFDVNDDDTVLADYLIARLHEAKAAEVGRCEEALSEKLSGESLSQVRA